MADLLVPDLSHYQPMLTPDRAHQAAAVVAGVMFKATQGTGFTDPNFAGNCAGARAAGLKFGAYHFADGADPGAQIQHFLATVPDDATFLVLDWEANNGGADATRAQAQSILSGLLRDGRPVAVYSGNYARSHGGYLPGAPAWVPAYGNASLADAYKPPATIPLVAWQYTNGRTNGTSMPTAIPGIGPCDVSVIYRPELLGLIEEEDVTGDEILKGIKAFNQGEKPPADGPGLAMFKALTKAQGDNAKNITVSLPAQDLKATVTS